MASQPTVSPITNSENSLQSTAFASIRSNPKLPPWTGFWQPPAILRLRMENAAIRCDCDRKPVQKVPVSTRKSLILGQRNRYFVPVFLFRGIYMEDKSTVDEVLDVGALMGRRQAFSLVAGRCSAADAEILDDARRLQLLIAVESCRDQLDLIHISTRL